MKNIKKFDRILLRIIAIFSLLSFITSVIYFVMVKDYHSWNFGNTFLPGFIMAFSLLSFIFSIKPKDGGKNKKKELLYCIFTMLSFMFLGIFPFSLQIIKDYISYFNPITSGIPGLIPYGASASIIIFSFLGLKEFYNELKSLPPSQNRNPLIC
jgi:hypothetical protein